MLSYNTANKEFEYTSKNKITYSLYEGETIPQLADSDERKTSDIIFIVLDDYVDINTHFVDFVYGASFLGEDKDLEKTIEYYVDRFEEENKDLVEEIQKNCLSQ